MRAPLFRQPASSRPAPGGRDALESACDQKLPEPLVKRFGPAISRILTGVMTHSQQFDGYLPRIGCGPGAGRVQPPGGVGGKLRIRRARPLNSPGYSAMMQFLRMCGAAPGVRLRAEFVLDYRFGEAICTCWTAPCRIAFKPSPCKTAQPGGNARSSDERSDEIRPRQPSDVRPKGSIYEENLL